MSYSTKAFVLEASVLSEQQLMGTSSTGGMFQPDIESATAAARKLRDETLPTFYQKIDDFNTSLSNLPDTFEKAGSKFVSGGLSGPNLAKIGAASLIAGAGIGTSAALANRIFGKKKKKKRSGEFLAAATNPYFRSAADIGGATGATAGTLGGLLGGRYAGTKAADALKLGQDSFGRTALQIGGQALGTVLGGTVGGILGYEALKKKRKKRDNPMLPDMYRNA